MKILNTAHASYSVTDLKKTLDFYEGCLGLKRKWSLTMGQTIDKMKLMLKEGRVTEEAVKNFEEMDIDRDTIWIVYVEVAPHQYLEFFPVGAFPREETSMKKAGYQHLALEVDDIFKAREELVAKGVDVLTEVALGVEETYQFWIRDPDGNRIELMQYTDLSLQLLGN